MKAAKAIKYFEDNERMEQMANTKRCITSFCLVLILGLAACNGVNNEAHNGQEDNYQEAAQPVDEIPYISNEHEAADWSGYPIIINGVGFTNDFFVMDGESFATHIPLHPTVDVLGFDVIQGGSQISIQKNGESLAALSVENYLAFGDERNPVGMEDTFMAEDDYFTIYVPISLFRELGFVAYYSSGHVFVYESESDTQ